MNTVNRVCAICHAAVTRGPAERGWIDLEGMPRLFFCPHHWADNPRFVRTDDGTWLWVKGEVIALRTAPQESSTARSGCASCGHPTAMHYGTAGPCTGSSFNPCSCQRFVLPGS
jgi:hypothetical protein